MHVVFQNALLQASENGHTDVVEYLVEHGADVSARDVCMHALLKYMH
jgi:ankyrin repeat protein